jgi:hypothetical protein
MGNVDDARLPNEIDTDRDGGIETTDNRGYHGVAEKVQGHFHYADQFTMRRVLASPELCQDGNSIALRTAMQIAAHDLDLTRGSLSS